MVRDLASVSDQSDMSSPHECCCVFVPGGRGIARWARETWRRCLWGIVLYRLFFFFFLTTAIQGRIHGCVPHGPGK